MKKWQEVIILKDYSFKYKSSNKTMYGVKVFRNLDNGTYRYALSHIHSLLLGYTTNSEKAQRQYDMLKLTSEDYEKDESNPSTRTPRVVTIDKYGVYRIIEKAQTYNKYYADHNEPKEIAKAIKEFIKENDSGKQPKVQTHPDFETNEIYKPYEQQTKNIFQQKRERKENPQPQDFNGKTKKTAINYLNEKTGKNFSHNSYKSNKVIKARLNEGYQVEDFKKVIDIKVAEWKGGHFEKYLRPETLFGPKFESYLNQSMPTSDKEYVTETIPGETTVVSYKEYKETIGKMRTAYKDLKNEIENLKAENMNYEIEISNIKEEIKDLKLSVEDFKKYKQHSEQNKRTFIQKIADSLMV